MATTMCDAEKRWHEEIHRACDALAKGGFPILGVAFLHRGERETPAVTVVGVGGGLKGSLEAARLIVAGLQKTLRKCAEDN